MYDRESDLTNDDIILDEEVALAHECETDVKLPEVSATFEDMVKVVTYVKNDVDTALMGSSWTNINNEPYVGNLDNNFSVYHRITPCEDIVGDTVNDITSYPSLASIRSGRNSFVIGCDAEWTYYKEDGLTKRFILSWQFAYIKDGYVNELIFLVKNTKARLKLNDALSVVWANSNPAYVTTSVKVEDIRRYGVSVPDQNGVLKARYYEKRSEAIAASGNKRMVVPIDNINKKAYHGITLVFHFGVGDVSSFYRKGLNTVFRGLNSIQKGMVSMKAIKLCAELKDSVYVKHKRLYPFALSIRDTACHTPAKHRSLEALGDALGVPKLDVEQNYPGCKERMDQLLMADPLLFLDYGTRDSLISLLWTRTLYGENKQIPVTLTSATASVMRQSIAESLDIDTGNDNWKEVFNNIYRGIETVDTGTKANYGEEIPFIQGMEAQPINLDTHAAQYIASLSYAGGWNSCSMPGYYEECTWDVDICNAYPNSMCLCKDVDFSNPIAKTYNNCKLSDIADEIFKDDGPTSMVFAEVDSFAFPEDTPFPCIVVKAEDIPIYPLTYNASTAEAAAASMQDAGSKNRTCKKKKVKRVCTTGPELWLAHQLGAEVIIKRAYLLNTLKVTDEDGSEVDRMSLSAAVKQFVVDRRDAKAAKSNICDTLLKVMINSMYGKTAQNVKPKKTYSPEMDETVTIGPSSITNPVLAAMITSIVRCVLIAAQTECVKLGYKTYSVTTDGFITTMDLETLKGLNLYGFADKLHTVRLFLTDGKDDNFWEVKHWQGGNTPGLLNFSTRGNVSLRCDDEANDNDHPHGVCAHCGIVSGEIKDSYEDRKWLSEAVLSRTTKVSHIVKLWTTLKELVTNKRKKLFKDQVVPNNLEVDFEVTPVERKISADFDMKRKPVRSSFYTVEPIIDGVTYEIANFDTEPYKDVAEFLLYRNQAKWVAKETPAHSSKCLRTTYDWETYFWPGIESKLKTLERKSSGEYVPSKKTPAKRGLGLFKKAIDYTIDRKIRNCLYAYRGGFIDIPLITNHSSVEFMHALNKSGISNRRFDQNDYKNYGKANRLPKALKSGDPHIIKHFLEAQEPVLSQLIALELPEEFAESTPFDDI